MVSNGLSVGRHACIVQNFGQLESRLRTKKITKITLLSLPVFRKINVLYFFATAVPNNTISYKVGIC